jgi:hypothetical protein
MANLSEVILDLEKDAAQREHQSAHGTLVSSIADDVTEGCIARVVREIVAKLKKVDSF